ncbi:MAG: hypothetical protein COV38_16140 [Bdellovibrionales bacterium CG11_big_fil_rev_8_21_14_0_20_38_13]|nr:MAG: hypothetical protein COW79_02820 [Bdellovibrionales bacterium CG22_combo_CG10-13_8_21_14_all_38_13]PIR28352.1 MAG: hypothetical protein COV38_16140 [Bdellovibrionales bacterium CG11_big_fil_rev_8_21_14_0_20_38_13]
MLDTTIQVRTNNFDGPLGLLLHLVQKEEMDIKSLDLTRITAQYLDYLAKLQEVNFDVAGDYLFLASTLLLLKSKSAVSQEEVERLRADMDGDAALAFTSEAELVKRLEELQLFQKMGERLWQMDKKGHEVFTKPKIDRKAIVNSILLPMDLEKLTEAMMDFITKQRKKYTVVKRDRLSIKEKLIFLKENLKLGEKSLFTNLLSDKGLEDTDDVVITFISLLELARLNRISVFQNEDRGEIYIDVVKSLEDFNVESANGFEDENAPEPLDLPTQELATDETPVLH